MPLSPSIMRDRLANALWCSLLIAPAHGAAVTPEIFAPGVVSGPNHEAAPVFDIDGTTLYFQRSSVVGGTILVTHKRAGGWSTPQIAPFSGVWDDIEPAMAPDGSFMVFISNRPATAGGKGVQGTYNGKLQNGGNMWRMERHGRGWSDPVRLPETINRSPTIFAPAIVADGSIYFMDIFGEQKPRFRLYRSQFRNGTYETAEPLPFSDGSSTDVDPAVAPDESFMVFGSGRLPATSMDLFVIRREGSQWGMPVHLGELNSPGSDAEPRFSRDLRTLYFSSERTVPVVYPRSLSQARLDLQRIQAWDNGQYNIWFVSLPAVLERLK